MADDHAPLEPGRGGAGRDRLELGGANLPGIVQVDVDRSAVPLGEAEDDVELAVQIGVDADRVDAADDVGTGAERLVEQLGHAGRGDDAALRERHELDVEEVRHLVPEQDERLEAIEANLCVDVDVAPHATGPERDGLLDEPPCPLCDRRLDLAPDRLLRLDPLGHAAPAAVRDPGSAEERLVEVHVALHEGGQKESTAEVHVLLRLGRRARLADRRDPTALAEHVGPSVDPAGGRSSGRAACRCLRPSSRRHHRRSHGDGGARPALQSCATSEGGRAMVELSEEVRGRVQAPNFWHLGTINRDGSPHITPMWIDLEGDHVMFNTAIGRVKEENLRRDPRVSLSHIDGENPYDRVEIRGRVIRFVEGEEADRSMDRLALKYVGTEHYGWRIPGERRIMMIVEPTRVRHVVGVEPFRPGILPEP